MEQHQREISKVAARYAKRQSLAAVATLNAKDKPAGVKINETRHVDATHSLQSLNSNIRRSPRKRTEMQPLPDKIKSPKLNLVRTVMQPPPDKIQPSNLNPGPNSTGSPNITPNAMDASNNLDSNDDIQQKTARKKRGKTMMTCMRNEKAEIEFNERGQPIGSNSKHLSSYLGTLAREMIPLTISEWKKVDAKLKKDLWTCIQSKFMVDEAYKGLMIKMLGLRWREAKSRLVSAIKVASTCPDASSRLAMLKPDTTENVQEWNDFVKEKLSEKFGETSKKFKAMRDKNKIPHTMSRKGYARLEEDMKKETGITNISRDELWCKAHTKKNGDPPNSVVADCIAKIKEHSSAQNSHGTTSVSGDGVSHIFGNEHRGRVRGLGFGVAPSQIGVYAHNSKKVVALENQVIVQRDMLTNLEARVDYLTNLIMTSRNDNVADMEMPQNHTPQSHRDSNNMQQVQDQQERVIVDGLMKKKCRLLSWGKNVVAEGTIASTEPDALVHFVKLGAEAWKVWVDVAVEPEALLFRPNSEMSTIQEAVGSPVAWHKDFISLV